MLENGWSAALNFFNSKDRFYIIFHHLELSVILTDLQIQHTLGQGCGVRSTIVDLNSSLLLVIMRVAFVDQGLEVSYFNWSSLVVNDRVQTDRVTCILGQETLNRLVVKQLLLAQPQNLESLLLGNEAALNPESLFCYLLATLVLILFKFTSFMLFSQKPLNLGQTIVKTGWWYVTTELFLYLVGRVVGKLISLLLLWNSIWGLGHLECHLVRWDHTDISKRLALGACWVWHSFIRSLCLNNLNHLLRLGLPAPRNGRRLIIIEVGALCILVELEKSGVIDKLERHLFVFEWRFLIGVQGNKRCLFF